MSASASWLRTLVVTGMMVSAAVAGVLGVPTNKLADTRVTFNLSTAVPKAFGDWKVDASVTPLPPSPDQQRVLDEIYDQILSRTYVNSRGERMMLSITYGSKQTQQLRAHRQEVCYAAQGFRISGLEHPTLGVGGTQVAATRMVAQQGARVEPVTYWFTTGDQVVRSYMERELAQLRYTLSGVVPDGYLVRVSNLSPDGKASFPRHLDFVNDMLTNLDPELRRRLIGRVG